MRIIAGKKSHKRYRPIGLPKIIGKTIETITETVIEGEYGDQRCTNLLFTDGTTHGFVMPSDD